MEGGIGLRLEGPRDPHAAGGGEARQVVAHQIKDHQVLGPLLGVEGEGPGRSAVALRILAPRRRTLHRADGQTVARPRHEQLRRDGEDAEPLDADQGAVRDGLARPHRRVEGERVAGIVEVRRKGQVRLIDVPRRDQALGPRHSLRIGRGVEGGGETLQRLRGRETGERLIEGVGVQPLHVVEQAEPDQRRPCGPEPGRQPVFERKAELVAEQPGGMGAVLQRRIEGAKDAFHLIGRAGAQRLTRGAVESGDGLSAQAVFEQDERLSAARNQVREGDGVQRDLSATERRPCAHPSAGRSGRGCRRGRCRGSRRSPAAGSPPARRPGPARPPRASGRPRPSAPATAP